MTPTTKLIEMNIPLRNWTPAVNSTSNIVPMSAMTNHKIAIKKLYINHSQTYTMPEVNIEPFSNIH